GSGQASLWRGRTFAQPGQQPFGLHAPVAAEAPVGERPQGALGVGSPPEADEAERPVETRLRHERSPGIEPKVFVPRRERAGGWASAEVRAVSAPVGGGFHIQCWKRMRV